MFKYRSILTEVALFFATLACAWYWQWQADDLVWALWISSLTIGYMTLVFGPLIWLLHKVPWVEIRKDTSIKDIKQAWLTTPKKNFFLFLLIVGVGIVFFVGFFTFHFGLFHFVHGAFLSGFFPLQNITYAKSPMQLPWFALKMLSIHWPFVLASAISQYTRIYSTKKDHPKKQDFLFAPYNAVIRMHFMIFLFAGLKAIQMQNFVFYAVVLFAYFFPWQSIFLTCRDMRKPV